MMDDLTKYSNNDQLREENITFVSSQYVRDTFLGTRGDDQKQANERFMFALALCHSYDRRK